MYNIVYFLLFMSEKDENKAPAKKYFFQHLLAAGLAGSITECLTICFDVTKCRMMMDRGNPKIYKNLFDCFKKITSQESPFALFKGLSAGIYRQMIYASLRIALFDYFVKSIASNPKDPRLIENIVSGIMSGAIGITVANPTDVIKVRMIMNGQPTYVNGVMTPVERLYKNTLDCFIKSYQKDGIYKGYWAGWLPNVVRNSIVNPAELATYFYVKNLFLKHTSMPDNYILHIMCGFLAGFVASLFGNPIEVVRTRLMDDKKGEYKRSAFTAFSKILKNEGIFAFYKGWPLFLLRIGTFNTIVFFVLEKMRDLIVPHFKENRKKKIHNK